jgi:D-serine deaminase-like pyridoxal phosphate-dependent protein
MGPEFCLSEPFFIGSLLMSNLVGLTLDQLETPQLLIDLDVVDANVQRLLSALRDRSINVRVHFKSLKCSGLARYLAGLGIKNFLCAKLNEAEVLAAAGLTDILIANQIVGPHKLRRLTDLARRAQIRVCVDEADNVLHLSRAVQEAGVQLGVLVEVDIGMHRCGVEPGEPALALARQIHTSPGLRFDGLQGYDGHLQLLADPVEKRSRCEQGLARLIATRRLIEAAAIPVAVVTGAGTGTWEYVSAYEGVTEIQPGSFILMDCAYNQVRPEFGCSLSIMAQVISRRPQWYVLDAGSKAISRDFGTPVVKDHNEEKLVKLSEEHATVECDTSSIHLGDRREVIPAHCCATMNLHRECLAIRKGRVEAVWPIEASGRYY